MLSKMANSLPGVAEVPLGMLYISSKIVRRTLSCHTKDDHRALLTLDTIGSHGQVAEIQKTQATEEFVQDALCNGQDTHWRAIDATLVKTTLVGPGDPSHLAEGDARSDKVDVLPHRVRDMIPNEVV